MLVRCGNRNHPTWQRYGAKGTRVCERWLVFENFLADMGLRPSGTTIDRIDSTGDYEPSNCRWATQRLQQRNKSSNHLITHNGETRCIMDWAVALGLPHKTLYERVRRGERPPHAFRPLTHASGAAARAHPPTP